MKVQRHEEGACECLGEEEALPSRRQPSQDLKEVREWALQRLGGTAFQAAGTARAKAPGQDWPEEKPGGPCGCSRVSEGAKGRRGGQGGDRQVVQGLGTLRGGLWTLSGMGPSQGLWGLSSVPGPHPLSASSTASHDNHRRPQHQPVSPGGRATLLDPFLFFTPPTGSLRHLQGVSPVPSGQGQDCPPLQTLPASPPPPPGLLP